MGVLSIFLYFKKMDYTLFTMKLTFFGGAKAVTGANYMLESGNEKILIDCGLNQGSNFAERKNFEPFP